MTTNSTTSLLPIVDDDMKQFIHNQPNHYNILDKLNEFIVHKKIPNILFTGEYGSGKKTILSMFLHAIYHGLTMTEISQYVMIVNCSHSNSKGIRTIRENLKFFAKTNIDTTVQIKSVVLLNAENLTTDAQSALRRCIELFSKNTRFFMVVQDSQKLLKPILSRFCTIYVPLPTLNTPHTPHTVNINTYNHNHTNHSYSHSYEHMKPFSIHSLRTNLYNQTYRQLGEKENTTIHSIPKQNKELLSDIHPDNLSNFDWFETTFSDFLLSTDSSKDHQKLLFGLCEQAYTHGLTALNLIEWLGIFHSLHYSSEPRRIWTNFVLYVKNQMIEIRHEPTMMILVILNYRMRHKLDLDNLLPLYNGRL